MYFFNGLPDSKVILHMLVEWFLLFYRSSGIWKEILHSFIFTSKTSWKMIPAYPSIWLKYTDQCSVIFKLLQWPLNLQLLPFLLIKVSFYLALPKSDSSFRSKGIPCRCSSCSRHCKIHQVSQSWLWPSRTRLYSYFKFSWCYSSKEWDENHCTCHCCSWYSSRKYILHLCRWWYSSSNVSFLTFSF